MPGDPAAIYSQSAKDAAAYLQSEEWRRKNARRFELIQKKNRSGLSLEEAREFDELQAEACHLLRTAFPAAPLDSDRLEAIERRLALLSRSV
jgi:hypothetical protein